MAESRTSSSLGADHETEVGLDWTHTQETVIQHHETGRDMEPSGERKRGRPRNSWRRDTLAELQRVGMTEEAERAAQSRVRWRSVVDGLCSTTGEEGHYSGS